MKCRQFEDESDDITDGPNDQMMSQQHQVVETTPGHSQKLFTASETLNLTEKVESSHQRHNRQHNTLGSLLGVPLKLSNGIAGINNNQTYIHR